MTQELITIQEARERVLHATGRLPTERVDIGEALGRVLADDVAAAADVPPFPSSAMDGYAVLAGPAGRRLTVIGESRAGTPSADRLSEGAAIRISTGGSVPDGATAVIRQEDTQAGDGQVEIQAATEPGQNIRPAGDDMRAGAPILRRGTRLGPSELGAAVAAGAGSLVTSCRPRVAVLCTGDELRAPGEPLGPGEIHNSNGPMLVAAAIRCGAVAPRPGRLPDDRARTEAGLAQALKSSDVVVVSGGVSVGPHDHVKPALAALGVEEVFWRVALQPGKPTWFGVSGSRLVFGLPGNPVSAAVTFSLFVAPALATIQGAPPPAVTSGEAILATAVARNPQREQAIRVVLERRASQTFATPNGPQGSHIVTSLVGAGALALIPAGEGRLEAGTPVSLVELIR
jgi:molybdopterin molybdotransferase